MTIFVNVRTGCQNLVIVNVHFEPELILKILRLITPHWPHYPDTIGKVMVTSIFVSQRKEDSMFGIKLSPTVTWGKLPHFTLHLLMFSKLHSLTFQGTPQSVGITRTLSRIDRAFINIPMAEARGFHCFCHVFENLVKRSILSESCSCTCVYSKTDCSVTPELTHSELDVQTSVFCSFFETAQ